MDKEAICTTCGLYNGNHSATCGWVLMGIHDKLDKIIKKIAEPKGVKE